MSNYPPQYAYPSAPPMVRALPNPPRLHWGVMLALELVTVGLFAIIWYMVLALWVKRVSGRKSPFWWALAYVLYIPGSFVLGFVMAIVAVLAHVPVHDITAPLQLFIRLVGFVIAVGAAFSLKNAFEADPINLSLSGVMTFLFGPIYFQYHLRDWTPEGGGGEASVTQGLGLSGPMAPIVRDAPVTAAVPIVLEAPNETGPAVG